MYFLYFIACLFWIVTLHLQLINKPGLADSGQYALKEKKWTGLSREENGLVCPHMGGLKMHVITP